MARSRGWDTLRGAMVEPVRDALIGGTDAHLVADSTRLRGPGVFLGGLALLAGGLWLALVASSTWDHVIGYAMAVIAVYGVVFVQGMHPPFMLEADADGITIRWGFRRLSAPVNLAWDEVSSVSEGYIQLARSREPALLIWAADLRPAIARAQSQWVRLLLWSRQITRRKQVVAIPARAASCRLDELQRRLVTLKSAAALNANRTSPVAASRNHPPAG